MLSAIVVAAGKSKRFKNKTSKVLVNINSKPVIFYSLSVLGQHPDISEIIVVASSDNLKAIAGVIRKYKINKVKDIVLGGKERKDSVLNGLRSLSKNASDVLIHDGARPFIDNGIISSVIAAAKFSGAAVSGVPVNSTVKRVDPNLWVKETVDRDGLWEIQTPQVFSKEIILKAYSKFGSSKVTDDAMLVEKTGVKIKLARGSYNNIKITALEDLIIAGAIFLKIKGKY